MFKKVYGIEIYDKDGDFVVNSKTNFEQFPTEQEIEIFIADNKDKYEDYGFGWVEVRERFCLENMNSFKEIVKDLFEVDRDEYVLAHCVSLDCAMGAGIAKEFTELHDCLKSYSKTKVKMDDLQVGETLRYKDSEGIVYNLFTKEKYWQKAGNHLTHQEYLDNLKSCLEDLKLQMEENEETKLAIPRIGSGLDKCNWEEVKKVINEVFEDSDIEVLVCYLD